MITPLILFLIFVIVSLLTLYLISFLIILLWEWNNPSIFWVDWVNVLKKKNKAKLTQVEVRILVILFIKEYNFL